MTPRTTSKWVRFVHLPPQERALVVRAALRLGWTLAGLRLLGFRRCHALILRFAPGPRDGQACGADRARQWTAKLVRAAASVERNFPLQPNCLERSLALWWTLRRNGIPAELHIGGRKSDRGFEAHAWVEWNGEVLNDSADVHQHYARFDAPVADTESSPR
ncbi:MAG: lasso peptide biosynthesis B2 protein [Acidobacteriia bacterium]|nr:lasso peptide biosynthesis B2 protein [Terriglobia bacterium]